MHGIIADLGGAIADLGGAIEAESEEGVGATFRIYLPAIPR